MLKKVAVTDFNFNDPMGLRMEERMLKRVGASIVAGQCKTEGEVIDLAKDAIAVINYSAPMNQKVIEALKQCKIIVRRAVGVDGIDIPVATRRGILVCNVPDYCTEDVSDHVLAMIFCLQKRILPLHQSVMQGRWNCFDAGPIYRIAGKILGILGLGRIGQTLAKKARFLRMKVIAHDPYLSCPPLHWVEMVSLNDLLRRSDFVSIHIPLTEKTVGLIGASEIRKMKRTAFLINTSRGRVVEEDALFFALSKGWIRGAGLDVLSAEPPGPWNPLLKLNNLLVTPHAAAYSEESLLALRRGAIHEVTRFLKGGLPKNIVNPELIERQETHDRYKSEKTQSEEEKR